MSAGRPDDAILFYDEKALESVRKAKKWLNEPKYFNKVRVAPAASAKMLMHSMNGVEKGISQNQKPLEVMGLMLGRPCVEDPHTMIVTDVFPLPVEGFETRVVADDPEVDNYMIELGELLDTTRKERFMGWYHSHPFDVESYSHCFLSSTDVSTQLSWQRAEDQGGNPWVAIVVDPLRSIAKGRPEMGAFRVYDPKYTPPANETPDGKIVTDDRARTELWGSAWNRYYTLEIEYFMTTVNHNLINFLSEKYLWMRTLSATPMLERENRERYAERVRNVAEKLSSSDPHKGQMSTRMRGLQLPGSSGGSSKGSDREESALKKVTLNSSDLAVEQCQCQTTQLIKDMIFNQMK